MAGDEDVKELIKRRGSYKGRLTTFINYCTELGKKNILVSTDAKELQLRMSKLESLYEHYDQVQLQLECSVEDAQTQYASRSEFESQYYQALATAQDILNKYNKYTAEHDSSDKGTRASAHHQLIKLPTIQLPKFNGMYDNWLEFRDTFTSLIHSNDDIDEINKFHYLRASLDGSASVVIQSIDFSASNYSVAWKLLCERFDNKHLLIQNHISALFNVETITKESSTILKRLIDQLNKNIRALESLGEPVQQWDTLLIYIVTQKLDQKTYREWEEFKGRVDKEDRITFNMFIKFIRNRADLIETLELSRNNHSVTHKQNSKFKSMVSIQNNSTAESVNKNLCPNCKGDHSLSNCSHFLALSNEARLKLLPNYKVCFNCFRLGHFANRCKKQGCKICRRRHNTLVHLDDLKCNNTRNEGSHLSSVSSSSSAQTSTSSSGSNNNNLTLCVNASSSSCDIKQHDVLLSTALIKLYDTNNHEHIVRAVLDSGSTSCLITQRLSQMLNLKTCQINKSILGINNVTSHVGKMCRVSMKSLNDTFATDINCFILPSITSSLPNSEIDIRYLKIPSDICLADPIFYKPGEVDILLGADIFWDLIGSRNLKLGDKKPVLFETKLGWVISGPITYHRHVASLGNDIRCNLTNVSDTHVKTENDKFDLTRFWQLDEVNQHSLQYSSEEKLCEEHFVKNTFRLDDGRFCVRIPLKLNPDILGNSLQRATQCLLHLERRLKNKPDLSKMYYDFMSEYELLGHMSECQHPETNHKAYFIPHHGVLRESSTTTKLRVVYNASSSTSSGISFNDIQMIGPTVQDDLMSILLRFRKHKYILSADVEKMYRQVVIHPDDRHLQQILWRSNTSESIKTFQLNTVTYGTASAPFLATRCLKQIGLDCSSPKIAEIIQHDFYVDDLLTGSDDFDDTLNIRLAVTDALASAGMTLRKWKSNNPRLIPADGSCTPLDLNFGSHEPSKLLGLGWSADDDKICFSTKLPLPNGNSKRDLLSVIAQIFDPLGLLAPAVIVMKMLLQSLWLRKLSWDEPLSPDIHKHWNTILISLPSLNKIKVPRMVVCDSYQTLELHVFSDASERAYGACVYVRTVNNNGCATVRLLAAKSRVAPIKPTTIPRLELCGALIGTRLYEKVLNSFRCKMDSVSFWTDSTIVLSWLQILPSRLQPFVRNRVAEILERAGNCRWLHVPTKQNPADLISRGLDISSLQMSDLWWTGPDYLKQVPIRLPSQPKHLENLPETKSDISLSAILDSSNCNVSFIDFSRFSNYTRLLRSIAYVLRFVNRTKGQSCPTFLTEVELRTALKVIIKTSQDESFLEYKLILKNENLPKKSPLIKFNVFLDDDNIMRVGGRLDHSDFSHDKKHPILLQSAHIFTKLLFESEHKRLLHAGPQLLLATIRETYWPIGGRNLAKACYHKCVRCSRMKGEVVTPMMGNLPRHRLVSGGFPFENVGLDYAGPIMSASRQGRGCRLVKVYIAIFVCFTTKAIHLELVGDLTSKCFLLALRRFISRRGKPHNIYSDNGKSFVGAFNDISKFLKSNCNSLGESLANEGVSFHFIPPYTPHFGGLWEAGVKSTKFHLMRVLGNCHLTYEELNTLLTQIEAILNSRPLTPLSSDPADCTPLTPGHFIIGRPLSCLPQPDYENHSTNYITRFHRIEQLRQHFWSRWSKEYVAELQQRAKWRVGKSELKLDTLVVVKEDHLPPLKWRLGRITAVYPGPDGIVRVADIRTSTGVIRRAFSKICPLPVSSDSC